MITEADALAALPPKGFLRDYVLYCSKCSDANAAYHIGGGLAVLSQTIPQDVFTPYGSPMYGNVFTLAVGQSTESRKSASVNFARRLLLDAEVGCVGEPPGSAEGLHEMLRANPQILFAYSEFGDFLAKVERGYLVPLKTAYTDAYDCVPLGRALAKSQRGVIKNPRVSVIGGSTLEFLERYTEPADWTGGFMARFLTLYADRERTYPLPPEHVPGWQVLVERLQVLAGLESFANACGGLDEAAKKIWIEWFMHTEEKLRTNLSARETRGAIARAPGMAMKIALLLGWDYGAARSGEIGWRITPAELEPAIRITELHVESVLEIGDRLAPSQDLRDKITIGRLVGERPISFGEISRKSKVGLKIRVHQLIDTLLEERIIRRVSLRGRNDLFVAWGVPVEGEDMPLDMDEADQQAMGAAPPDEPPDELPPPEAIAAEAASREPVYELE